MKEVGVDDRRYILCRTEEEARKDTQDRTAIVEALRAALTRGETSLAGNKGYRRRLKSEGVRFTDDEDKVDTDARDDGLWSLRTSTTLAVRYVAPACKQLWRVEAIIRSMKAVLDTRPICHQRDDRPRGVRERMCLQIECPAARHRVTAA